MEVAMANAKVIGENDLMTRDVYFASASSEGRVYIHGGCLEAHGKHPEPLGEVLLFDQNTLSVGEIKSTTLAPRLCKHQMAIRDFKLLLVGGWDGLKRRHQCWFFNLRTHQWILLRETIPSGDVEQSPAGLSSHSLCPISADSYVVTGREGSVRFQKRFACIFSVKISEAEGEVPKYEYARVSHQMGSRSGHSSHYAASFCRGRKKSPALLMIGGRNEETIDSMPLASFSNVQTPNYDVRQKEILYSVKMKLNSIKPAFRIHACVTVDNWIILHGGLVFNKIRDNVLGDSLIIYDSNTSRWYTIKISAGKSCILKRFGHSLASINGKFYILGGSQSDETIISQMVELVIEN